jgi:hypothetical protein
VLLAHAAEQEQVVVHRQAERDEADEHEVGGLDDELPRDVVDQLTMLRRLARAELPDGAAWVFAHAWVRLYSVIALEALGQLDFMFADVEPYFEAELRAVAREVGLEYVPRQA